MAYADRNVSGNRVVAIVVVSLIVAVMGYAFVTGLSYKYIKKVADKLNTFDVAPPPPPPPPDVPPPPPPPDMKLQPPPVVSPPPIVQSPTPPVIIQTVQTPPPVIQYTPKAAPPAPPAPPAPRPVSQAAGLKGNPAQFFGPDAYPAGALREGASGRVVAALTVGADGRVSDCSVTTSSGNSDLDSTTCRIAKSRVRFSPAKDDSGAAVTSKYTLPVRWVLPDQ